MKKIDTDAVVQYVTTRTDGVTVAEVAEQFAVTPMTARRFLAGLAEEGALAVVGSKPVGGRGRPRFLYGAPKA